MKRQLRGNEFGPRDLCLFTLGIKSGLRISDLLQLAIGGLIDDKGRVKHRIVLGEQKTGKSKDFPISETAAKAIKEYLTTR